MNILHHKSWHVRSKQNIERVRRDEAKAEEEEQERKRKIALAESEARTDFLRSRANAGQAVQGEGVGPAVEAGANDLRPATSLPSTSSSADVAIASCSSSSTPVEATSGPSCASKNINFFQDVETKEVKKNIDYEREKKEEKEAYEKKLGILTYLGQSAVQYQTEKPWYTKSTEERNESKSNKKVELKKNQMDPYKDMKKYVDYTKCESRKRKISDNEDSNSSRKSKKRKKHKKSDKKEKKKHDKIILNKSISDMRKERERRECAERQRAEELMKRLNPTIREEKKKEEPKQEPQQYYNSAFNPEFSKHLNRKKRRY